MNEDIWRRKVKKGQRGKQIAPRKTSSAIMDGLRNSVTTDGDVVRDLYINEELGGSNDPFILFSKSNRMHLTVFQE